MEVILIMAVALLLRGLSPAWFDQMTDKLNR